MDGNRTTERIDTVVIGAGQTGLAAGYHLQRHGVPFTILDADARVGDHWRYHWESMRLYSPARSDGLPGMDFPAAAYHYPSGREMGDFLETYASRFALPVESGVTVDEVVPAAEGDGGFTVRAGERGIHARRVIVATGPFRRPHVPDIAAALDPAIRQLHSSEYKNLSQLQDGPLLVVGVSHSGADIAYEAAATHRTMLSGQSHGELPMRVIDSWRARLVWPLLINFASHVLTLRTPLGRKMAPMIRSGGGPLLRVRSADLERVGVERHAARTVCVTDGKPTLEDGTVLDVANVVWCTGFQRDYGWVKVPGFVGDDGWPQGDRGVVASAPGLYFVGIPFQYGFTSMLVAGAGRDAGHVVRHLATLGGQRVAATTRPATNAR